MKDELQALRLLRSQRSQPRTDFVSLESRIMTEYRNQRATRFTGKRLASMLAVLLIGGVSFAWGYDIVSEWTVTVEEIDPATDRVTLENEVYPILDFEVEIPKEDTPGLLEAAANNEIGGFQVADEDETFLVQPLEEGEEILELEVLGSEGTSSTVKISGDRE